MKNAPKFLFPSKRDHWQLGIRDTGGVRGSGELEKLSIGRGDLNRTATYNDLLEGDLHVISTIILLSRMKIQLHTVEYARVRVLVIMQTCEYSFGRLRMRYLS